MLTLRDLQSGVEGWSTKNFGAQPDYFALLGAMEELGELAHADLKKRQNIRGTPEEHDADAKDAIGDIVIYLTDYCWRRGWDLQEIMEQTWDEVGSRNWVDFPLNGISE